MLLPISEVAATMRNPAIIIIRREGDMPHGFFGDRDSNVRAATPREPPYCGLFGLRGDAPPPLPSNSADHPGAGKTPLGSADDSRV